MKSAIFLDRDGVLCQKAPEGDYVKSWAEFKWLAGAKEAVRAIKEAGFLVVVVSKQRGVALGRYTKADVELIHNRMQEELSQEVGEIIDAFYFCPHDKDECECRKPKPGLILQAARDLQIDLSSSLFIGDSKSDIEAGYWAGVKTILVATRQGKGEEEGDPRLWVIQPDEIVPDLTAAVSLILTA